MKKYLLIMASILLLLFCIAVPVSAAGTTAEVNSATAHRGETVTFELTLKNGIEVGSGGIALSYDTNVLRLVSGKWEVEGTLLSRFDSNKEKGTFAYETSAVISGKIFTAKFQVLDTAAFGKSDIKMTVQLKDGSNAVIPVTNNSASLIVECAHDFIKKDTSEQYLKSAATCQSPAMYYKSCSVCGAKGSDTFESGSKLPHKYEKKVITNTYLKTPASCTSKAVYYYCCSTCDAKGTATFEYGELLPHTYNQQKAENTYLKSAADCEHAAVYYKSCICKAKGTETFIYGEKLGHTGGTATCTAKAICSRCGKEYGEMLRHTYNQEKATEKYLKTAAICTHKAVYYKSCVCGANGSDTFEYGDKLLHTFDQKVTANAYLKTPASCTSKAVYYYSCKCGEKGNTTFETGNQPSHSYKTAWSSNGNGHWHECSKCGDKKDMASHTPGAAATEYTAQACTVCGYVITPAFGHKHKYNTEWENDSIKHWHSCTGCSERADEAEHNYDNACDTICNDCGYVRDITHSYTTWMYDDTNHWYECSVCHEKSNEAAHTPGAEATESTAQTCTVCGYIIKEALGHTHSYSSEWKSDNESHWHECDCGDKKDNGEHTWDDGIVVKTATVTEFGIKKFSCTVCGHEKTESMDKLSESFKGTDTNSIAIWIIITLIIVVVIIAVVVFVIRRKK